MSTALEDPQTAINGMLLDIDHPVLGEMQLVGSPVHLSDVPMGIRRMPPRLGEHTEEVIAEFGLRQKERAAG